MWNFKKNQEEPITEEVVEGTFYYIEGYKAFTRDMQATINEFQYEEGKTYTMPAEDVRICQTGYHYCKTFLQVFQNTVNNYDMRIHKVRCKMYDKYNREAILKGEEGHWISRGKLVTNEITILEEIPVEEWIPEYLLYSFPGMKADSDIFNAVKTEVLENYHNFTNEKRYSSLCLSAKEILLNYNISLNYKKLPFLKEHYAYSFLKTIKCSHTMKEDEFIDYIVDLYNMAGLEKVIDYINNYMLVIEKIKGDKA